MPIDFQKKQVFLLDLDDTLICTTEARDWGLRRAYSRLQTEYEGRGDLSRYLTFKKFKDDLLYIYNNEKDERGKRFRDIEVLIFERYCNIVRKPSKKMRQLRKYCKKLPKNLRFSHSLFALAARLYWEFKEGKNGALKPFPDAYELFQKIRGFAYCVTEGKCNYQHTKLMLSCLEHEFEDVIIIKGSKEKQLGRYIRPLLKQYKKSEFVMIGDSPKDIAAGTKVGIDTVRIRVGSHADEDDIVKPTESFKSLTELSNRLE